MTVLFFGQSNAYFIRIETPISKQEFIAFSCHYHENWLAQWSRNTKGDFKYLENVHRRSEVFGLSGQLHIFWDIPASLVHTEKSHIRIIMIPHKVASIMLA